MEKLTLHTELRGSRGFVSSSGSLKGLVGKKGTAFSVLRPSGKVNVEGQTVDALSEGTFIPAGRAVMVVKAESGYVVVKEV